MCDEHEVFDIPTLVVINPCVVVARDLFFLALADSFFPGLWILGGFDQIRELPRETVAGALETIWNLRL